MGITVRPLAPDMATVFTEYLGGLDFGHAPHWASCYCRYYHTDCPQGEWMERTADRNRAEAMEDIANGKMKGYLAFDGDQCIGWCNANNAREYVRLQEYAGHLLDGRKVGCVICFVIHPSYRGRGVARLLLKHAIADFREQGYDAVMALPYEVGADADPQRLYRGTLGMYREYGFQEIERHDSLCVMWLGL